MLTMTGTPTGSTVELNWLPPLHPNGAIHYEIEYEPAMTPGDPVNAGNSSSPYFTLTLPNEFLTYNVRVAAVNTNSLAQSSPLLVCPGQNRQEGVQYTGTCLLSYTTAQYTAHMCEASLSRDRALLIRTPAPEPISKFSFISTCWHVVVVARTFHIYITFLSLYRTSASNGYKCGCKWMQLC